MSGPCRPGPWPFKYVFKSCRCPNRIKHMARFHQVWLIPTSFGDAIRCKDEMVLDEDKGVMRRIGAPVSSSSIIPVCIPLAELRTAPFLPSDLPDPTRSATEICNVCGFVAGFSVVANHPAWRTVRSTLGSFKEAYTLRAGNLIFLRGKLVFKGAVAWQVVMMMVALRPGLISDGDAAGRALDRPSLARRAARSGASSLPRHRHCLHAAQRVCSRRLSARGNAVSPCVVPRDA